MSDTNNLSEDNTKLHEKALTAKKGNTGKVSVHSPEGEEVARINIYEETVNIDRKVFIREEIKIYKKVKRETIEVTETLRRQELEIEAEGNIIQK